MTIVVVSLLTSLAPFGDCFQDLSNHRIFHNDVNVNSSFVNGLKAILNGMCEWVGRMGQSLQDDMLLLLLLLSGVYTLIGELGLSKQWRIINFSAPRVPE